MERIYDIITFDCYGTLTDWNSGIAQALARAAEIDRVAADIAAVLTAYHELEPVVEAETRRSYREVLIETARRAARGAGWELSPAGARLLPESVSNWEPFADTNAALQQLYAAGYRLGILSNIDDELLTATRRHFTVPFQVVVTAQQVGSYKPAHGHFEQARRLIGDGRWLHAAQSWFHDLVPAGTLGIPTVWINRSHEQPSDTAQPVGEFATLTEFAAWLTGEAQGHASAASQSPIL